jgi:hypothetical protein
MYPRAPVTRGDFDTTGLTAISLASGQFISSDNGLIGPLNTPVRHANTDPNTYEVHDGIGFHVVAIAGQTMKLGIYTFKSFTLAQGQTLNGYSTNGNGLALVSAGDMTINGTVDVTCAGNVFLSGLGNPNATKVYLAGPGGGAGGQPGATNHDGVSVRPGGGGTGGDNAGQAGGGGGAYADIGGTGGDNGGNSGAAGGSAYGDPAQSLLVGGSGGGSGGDGVALTAGSFGGGGGGFVLLVAQGTLTLGGGTSLGGVNAGGKDYDGNEAYECELPACELRLNSWWSGARGVRVLNFIGIPPEGERGEEIEEPVGAHLQGRGLNWYVPSLNEQLDGGGVLGELFDPGVLVQVLEARWLWAYSGDEHAEGRALLRAVAEEWLKVVRPLMNPQPELKRLRDDLEGRGARVAPSERLEVLRTHVRTKR